MRHSQPFGRGGLSEVVGVTKDPEHYLENGVHRARGICHFWLFTSPSHSAASIGTHVGVATLKVENTEKEKQQQNDDSSSACTICII